MDQSVFDTLRGSTHLQCWGVPKEDLQLREMPPYFGSLSNRCPSPSAQTVRTGGTSQTYSGTASRVSRAVESVRSFEQLLDASDLGMSLERGWRELEVAG